MRHRVFGWLAGSCLVMGLWVLAGCAGTAETVGLSVKSVGPAKAQGSGEKILVVPFEDQRLSQSRLGLRTHLWGGVTYFDVTDGKVGEAVARMVAEHLTKTGRQAWYGKPGAAGPEGKPDVALSGQVRDLSANAKSRFGSTAITVKFHVTLQAVNEADGSITRMTLEGSRDDAVFWFRPQEVEDLLNAALTESLDKILGDVKVDGVSWRLK
jgi:hypothetical protein